LVFLLPRLDFLCYFTQHSLGVSVAPVFRAAVYTPDSLGVDVFDYTIMGEESWLFQSLTGAEDGTVVRLKITVHQDPEGESAILDQVLLLEVVFTLDVLIESQGTF